MFRFFKKRRKTRFTFTFLGEKTKRGPSRGGGGKEPEGSRQQHSAGTGTVAVMMRPEWINKFQKKKIIIILTTEFLFAEADAIALHEASFAAAGNGDHVELRRVGARIARMPPRLQDYETRVPHVRRLWRFSSLSLCWVLFYFVCFYGRGSRGMHGMCVTVLYALACDH